MLFQLTIIWQSLFLLGNVAFASSDAPEVIMDFEGDGVSYYVEADSALRKMDDFSFDMDVRFSDLKNGNFFQLNEAWDQDGFYFQLYEGQLVLGFGDGGDVSQVMSLPNLLRTDRWYRLSGIKNGDQASLYIDGVMVASGPVFEDIFDSHADLVIGSGIYTPAITVREFILWSEPLAEEQIGEGTLGDSNLSLPVPMIHYDSDQSLPGRIKNSVLSRYEALRVILPAPEEGKGEGYDTENSVTSVDAPERGDRLSAEEVSGDGRGPVLVALTLVPLAIYACGLGVTGRRSRWVLRDFPLSLSLLSLAAMMIMLVIFLIRSNVGHALLERIEPPLPDGLTSFLESGLFIFSHFLLLASILLCFKLLTIQNGRFADLFAKNGRGNFRYFSMVLIALGVAGVCGLGATLIGFLSDSTVVSSSLSAVPAVYVAGLALAAFFAVRDGKAGHDNEDQDQGDDVDTGRRQLPDADVRRIEAKLEKVLDAERLYRDPNLTLRQLSDAVGVTEHRISEVLNHHIEANFYDFINGRRIEEAKLTLQQDRERTVLDIALEVGFNSKSTFYTAFKKVTGQSPAAFRRSMPVPTEGCETASDVEEELGDKPSLHDPLRAR